VDALKQSMQESQTKLHSVRRREQERGHEGLHGTRGSAGPAIRTTAAGRHSARKGRRLPSTRPVTGAPDHLGRARCRVVCGPCPRADNQVWPEISVLRVGDTSTPSRRSRRRSRRARSNAALSAKGWGARLKSTPRRCPIHRRRLLVAVPQPAVCREGVSIGPVRMNPYVRGERQASRTYG